MSAGSDHEKGFHLQYLIGSQYYQLTLGISKSQFKTFLTLFLFLDESLNLSNFFAYLF